MVKHTYHPITWGGGQKLGGGGVLKLKILLCHLVNLKPSRDKSK